MLNSQGGNALRPVEVPIKAIPVKRSVFIVDANGVIRYRYEGTVKAIFKKPKALARILAAI